MVRAISKALSAFGAELGCTSLGSGISALRAYSTTGALCATFGAELSFVYISASTFPAALGLFLSALGTEFTLKGKGIPDINTKKKGDLIIKVAVETPRNLNSKQKELLIAFSDSLGENNASRKQRLFKKLFK